MSKQATLATCIARMYEGGKLENSGTPPGTIKKPSPTLIGSLSNVEVKLNALEGKVEQIERVQTEVLQKLSSLCHGMESLEKSLMQCKTSTQESNLIKNVQREGNKDLLLTEVRSLCGETVDLLHNLKQESLQQRSKIECMESSLSSLDKVLGYVRDTFRNSKIVEFILNGVVPWRRQGLLDAVKVEKTQPDGNSIKQNLYHQSTQTSEEVKEVLAAEPEVTVPTVPKLPSPDAQTEPNEPRLSAEVSSKALRKAKEVTVKSREPTRVQTFSPKAQLETEKTKVHDGPKQETNSSAGVPANIKKHATVTTAKVEDVTEPKRALEQADVSQAGEQTALQPTVPKRQQQAELKVEIPQKQAEVQHAGEKPLLKPAVLAQQQVELDVDVPQKQADVPQNGETPLLKPAVLTQQQVKPDVDVPQKQAEVPQAGETPLLKPAVLAQQQVEQKLEAPQKQSDVSRVGKEPLLKLAVSERRPQEPKEPVKTNAGHTSQPKETVDILPPLTEHDECTADSEPAVERNQTNTVDRILEFDIVKDCGATSVQTAEDAKEGLPRKAESHILIIDDCPPLPAPFEHRIVSAKQVPMSTYYEVSPCELLGGGRFGQVHKCAELSSGLMLAAKMIKVRGMKERDEVKNEIGVMNQLNHVNLIQLYDAFESRTNLTLIMEYVEGGELFERIVDENYQLTELDTIVFTKQICEGVQYLHQQYILHLDLKPENILCVNTTGNQIKIIDFGLARKYRPREKLKVNFGTPEFLAPEVVNYDFVSFPTDMWSVGVITYMLLSGLSPFLGDNDAETMNNILHANWDFDAESFENVSEEAKDFISRLLVPAKCSRLSASGCTKHSWLNNLEDKAKMYKVRLKSRMRLKRYLVAHRQWKKHFFAVAAANRLKSFQQNRSVSTPN
ncbi:Myosin light chain kinase 3 [Triplophysa tibetana]|uniref:Myosin light chain kinase 3 n=1 Tax=Triplophysa tibetana TaxID=1572043 RepID=A0A5A9PMH6_9TELE|nr:Myosin light chain kinase 3 [Triplophysa tibetana]